MIVAALLAGALTIGLGASDSQGIGEDGAAVLALARVETRHWRLHGEWDSSDKLASLCETGPCWRAAASLDRTSRLLIVGGGVSWRQTPGWQKLRVWGRAGVRAQLWGAEARLVGSSAILSWDRDSHIDASMHVPLPAVSGLSLEPAWSIVAFDQGREGTNKRVGWAARCTLLYQFGGVR